MARHRIKVPAIGESVDQLVILEWHVELGNTVSEEDELVSVEAEKVDMVVPCPISGTLVEILAQEGDEVMVGDPLCIIESSL